MSYKLRKGKGKLRVEEQLSSSINMADSIPPYLADINEKLDRLLQGKDETDKTLSLILTKLSKTEKEFTEMKEIQTNLEANADYLSKEVDELKEKQARHDLLAERYAELEMKIDDLENRSKRNNIVLWNIPEGSEMDKTCEVFVKEFIMQHMELPGETVEIERAHRTPPNRRRDQDKAKPRPIHVKLLRYTDKIRVFKHAKTLKDKPFGGAKIFISDDVSQKVRLQRKSLRLGSLEKIRSTPGVQFAFIPFQIPARIVYKDKDGFMKSLLFNDTKDG